MNKYNMEQMINNLTNTINEPKLVESYKIQSKIVDSQRKTIEKLKNTLKHEREWIRKFEIDMDEKDKEIDKLNNEIIWEWNEQVIGLKETITELKEEINKLKTQLGEPFVPY